MDLVMGLLVVNCRATVVKCRAIVDYCRTYTPVTRSSRYSGRRYAGNVCWLSKSALSHTSCRSKETPAPPPPPPGPYALLYHV